MNVNDDRKEIETNDVFDNEGNFKPPQKMKNGITREGGKELLMRKLTGYISFVRGENPYTFPFRIYPNDIPNIKDRSVLNMKYPTRQLNGIPLTEDGHIQYLDLYISKMDKYQDKMYQIIKEEMINNVGNTVVEGDEGVEGNEDVEGDNEEEEEGVEGEEEMDLAAFSFRKLQKPLQALNIIFPHTEGEPIENYIGDKGLRNVVNINKKNNIIHFSYKKTEYGEIFAPSEIGKYSSKIDSICKLIKNSKGIVLIYAYYLSGGIIPLALALEEMGFNRYSSNSAYKNLLKPQTNSGLNYLMITGDSSLSPDNADDVKYVSGIDNKDGQKIKVILISRTGSEGLDFKNIRQIHVMDSWYTLNRIEQIIGRGVRTLSHCSLPFEERCVEIYLHATLLREREEESADLYLYRYAERKAIQLGKIYRILKEISIDCNLNQGQKQMSVNDLKQNISLNLSSKKDDKQIRIDYKIGDKPFTSICDYMENCDYKCSPNANMKELKVNNYTYNNDFIKNNNNTLVEKIKTLYRDKKKVSYTIDEIIFAINAIKTYPLYQIYYALTHLIKDNNEYLMDFYGRLGHLVNIDKYYLFQPAELTDKTASIFERMNPIDYKQNSVMVPLDFKNSAVMFDIPKEETSLDEIIELILEMYKVSFFKKLSIKSKVWFENLNFVLGELQTVYSIPLDNIKRYAIFHLLDTFSIEQKMTVLNNMENILLYLQQQQKQKQYDKMGYEIEQHLKNYFDSRRIKKYIILFDKEANVNKYFIKMEDGWKERQRATFEEILENNDELRSEYYSKFKPKMILKQDDINGFMTKFKNLDVVFKVRSGLKDRGTYLANGNRDIAVKIINGFLEGIGHKHKYLEIINKKTNIFDKYELSVILEILMRDQSKKRFLNPEQYNEMS
jgi:hypothetical protein